MALLSAYRDHEADAQEPARLERMVPRRYDFVLAPRDAGRHNQAWRYFSGTGGTLVLGILLQLVATTLIAVGLISFQDDFAWAKRYAAMLEKPQTEWAWEFFVVMGAVSFGCLLIALSAALVVMHGRGLATIINTVSMFRTGRFFLGFLIYAALLVVPFAISMAIDPGDFKLSFHAPTFALLLVLLIPMLLIQSGFEEMFFRGYLVQAMGALRAAPAVIVGFPALMFAGAHFGNPEFQAAPITIVFYFSFGVFMTLLAIREQGIELTYGAHFANNLITGVLVRAENSVLPTPSLFLAPPVGTESDGGGPVSLAFVAPVLFWLVMSWIYTVVGAPRRP